MSRVVWLLKKLQALKMAEETMAEEMVEETKLETHTRVQSAYIKIWCFVWYFWHLFSLNWIHMNS